MGSLGKELYQDANCMEKKMARKTFLLMTFLIAVAHALTSTTVAQEPDRGFQWLSPQFLTNESTIKITFPYLGSVYLSKDTIFDPNEDHFLLGVPPLYDQYGQLPNRGGTQYHYCDPNDDTDSMWGGVPDEGNYYVFYDGFYPDGGSSVTMSTRIITVSNRMITKAKMFVWPETGQPMVAAGYSDGTLELLDWNGNVVSYRDGLGEIYALEVDVEYSWPMPSLSQTLIVASSSENGSLRIIDPNNLDVDIAIQTDIGPIKAICKLDRGDVIVSTGIELRSFAIVREGWRELNRTWEVGNVQQIIDISGPNVTFATRTGGSIRIQGETIEEYTYSTNQEIMLSSAGDADGDGNSEFAIGIPGVYSSLVEVYEVPDFDNPIATYNIDGELHALEYHGGDHEFKFIAITDWRGGTVITPGGEYHHHDYLPGDIPLVKVHDYYMTGEGAIGCLFVDHNGPKFKVLPW